MKRWEIESFERSNFRYDKKKTKDHNTSVLPYAICNAQKLDSANSYITTTFYGMNIQLKKEGLT